MRPHRVVSALAVSSLASALRPAHIAKRHNDIFFEALDKADAAAPFPPPNPPLITFASAKSKEFLVDGKSIPFVDFDAGPT